MTTQTILLDHDRPGERSPAPPFFFITAAPRTAERAFWAHVMDCEAELNLTLPGAIEGHPEGWWKDFMMDQDAEEAMERRGV